MSDTKSVEDVKEVKLKKLSYVDDSTTLGKMKTMVNYLVNDIKKKPRSFKIGIFSIFLVIGFLASLQSIFQLSPVIFLTIAENTAGDADVIVYPTPYSERVSNSTNSSTTQTSLSLINFTNVESICDQVDEILGCAPRWYFIGKGTNLQNQSVLPSRTYVVGIDSKKDRSAGFGRRLNPPILQGDQVIMSRSLLRDLQIEVGDTFGLNLDIVGVVDETGIVDSESGGSSSFDDFLVTTVADLIDPFIDQFAVDGLNTTQLKDINQQIQDAQQTSSGPQLQSDVRQILIDNGVSQDNADTLTENEDNFNTFIDNLNQFNDQINDLPDNIELNSTEIAEQLVPFLKDALNVTINMTVVDAVRSPKGQWPNLLGNAMMTNIQDLYRFAYTQFLDNIDEILADENATQNNSQLELFRTIYQDNNVRENITEVLEEINPNDFALTVNIALKNRASIYVNADKMKKKFIEVTNGFYKIKGFFDGTEPQSPLGLAVEQFLLLKLFLDNMITTAVFLLIILSIILIYSLMISDVDDKTYEFGMLRALGLEKQSLVALIMMQGLCFAIPGMTLGTLFAYLLNSIVAYIFFDLSQEVLSYQLHYTAIILAFSLGFLIPIVSNYIPIRRAMSKTLRDSLDLYHRVVATMNIQIQKLEKLGISLSQTLIALMLIVMGLICYYFAPQAFLNEDPQLFLAIINMTLMLLILGLTLILSLIEVPLENLILETIFFFHKRDRNLKKIVFKNMDAHRRRNEKTTIMYSIALAFLIFTGTGFNLQTESIASILASTIAADIKVMIPIDLKNEFLDEAGLRTFMEDYKIRHPDQIQDYTFVTDLMNNFPGISKPSLSPLSRLPSSSTQLVGIEKNYLNSVMTEFYIPTEFDNSVDYPEIDGKKDMVYALFTRQGNQDYDGSVDQFNIISNSFLFQDQQYNQPEQQLNVILPEGLRYELSMGVENPSLLSFMGGGVQFRVKTRGMAKKFPGIQFSGYRTVVFYSTAVTSTEQYKFVLDYCLNYLRQSNDGDLPNSTQQYLNKIPEGSSLGLPKVGMLIKFARKLQEDEKDQLKNGLKTYFLSDQTTIYDVPELIETTNSTVSYITLFSITVGIVAITLSFFLILVSFTANVKENSWEFGVYRAIGLNKGQITRCYIYEALSLIMASGLLGSIVGIVIAVTLTLQFLMFLELPFVFIFPFAMFFFCFGMGIFVAITGSFYSLSDFRDKSISNIIKGLA